MSRSSRERFLRTEFHRLTVLATLQRSSTYIKTASDGQRRALRNSLSGALDHLALRYEDEVPENAHIKAIADLSRQISEEHKETLRGGRFRIGIAQKGLNLFLKYLWCAGWIAMPPHCPFDRVIIQLLPPPRRIAWTKLDDLGGYRGLVFAARKVAGDRPLALWELEEYARLVASGI